MSKSDETRIPCSKQRRSELINLKRRGENYDELLGKMVQQYDPDEAVKTP